MKIGKIQNNNLVNKKTSFKGQIPLDVLQKLAAKNTLEARRTLLSCLSYNSIYRGALAANPDKIARELGNKFNIHAEFGNNPFIATYSALTANIFHRLGLAQPTNVFVRNYIGTSNESLYGFCKTEFSNFLSKIVLGEDFPLRSVVMNEGKKWDDIQRLMIRERSTNHCSTSHFLHPFIHEFIHSAHLDNLMRKHGNGIKAMGKIRKDFQNKETIKLLQNETSRYGSTNPIEMVADEMTQLIVESLDPRTVRPSEMIFKMKRATEPFDMDKLIDAAWNGDVKTVNEYRKRKSMIVKYFRKLLNQQ